MEVSSMSKGNKGWNKMGFEGEWAKTLQKFLSKQQEEVPKGWLRAEKALEKMGYSGNSAGQRNRLLNAMAKDGFLEKKDFKIFDGTGRRVTAITHYKIMGKS
jgi:hypothetical protein